MNNKKACECCGQEIKPKPKWWNCEKCGHNKFEKVPSDSKELKFQDEYAYKCKKCGEIWMAFFRELKGEHLVKRVAK